MQYQLAERFKSIQGEGLFAGTPMAFVRFVGCSVGKKICHACDTDWEKSHVWRGGGMFSPAEIVDWARPYRHLCLTGGEPLDQDLLPILQAANLERMQVHIETSGTKRFENEEAILSMVKGIPRWDEKPWICVSPKPGYQSFMIGLADELKIIVPGLGSGEGWPTLQDAIEWEEKLGKPVFLQPRNSRFGVDTQNLKYVVDLLRDHPKLRLSVQLHKVLHEQ